MTFQFMLVPPDNLLVNQYYILAASGESSLSAGSYAYSNDLSEVVFYYDFFLTFHQEIKFLWPCKSKPINMLVIALRYISAFGYIPTLVLTIVSLNETTVSLTIEKKVEIIMTHLLSVVVCERSPR